MKLRGLLALPVAAVVAAPAGAHHSFAVHYNGFNHSDELHMAERFRASAEYDCDPSYGD